MPPLADNPSSDRNKDGDTINVPLTRYQLLLICRCLHGSQLRTDLHDATSLRSDLLLLANPSCFSPPSPAAQPAPSAPSTPANPPTAPSASPPFVWRVDEAKLQEILKTPATYDNLSWKAGWEAAKEADPRLRSW